MRALVLELVEGPTLADLIAARTLSGPRGLPLEEALPIAKQMAEALEAAHDRGIIHRDLKPANIKITPAGQVKVLDFGLAKMLERDPAASPMTMSPTLSVQATYAGVILGTAAYMSPEQARGKAVDRRADIWSFGCVLFEMLTGKQAFDAGETVSDAIAAILKNDPDWKALPAETPAHVRTLLRRCLQKDPQKRLPHIGIARIEIDEGPAESDTVSSRRPAKLPWLIAGVAGVAMLALSVPALRHLRETPPPDAPQMRTQIFTPASSDPFWFALSPDGRQLVFVASSDGASRLWVRSLASETARPLAGTEGATYPFWSPDSQSVAFFAAAKLKRVDIGGGAAQVLANLTGTARGGTWNRDGVILFASSSASPVFRVSAAGGEAVAVTKLERQSSHRFPQFLPDGRQFLFFVLGAPEVQGIYLGSIDSQETKRLTAADTAGVCTASGLLLWVRGGTLVAQRLDVQRRELVGNTVTVADHVGFDGGFNTGAFSVSAADLIAYRTGTADRRQLTWLDRSGKALGTLGAPDEAGLSSPRISPDERRVAVFRVVQGNTDIWLLDGSRTTRFTFDAALDRYPFWSPDGTWIVFDSTRKGTRDLYVKSSSGAGGEELLLESPPDKSASDWSADGRFILYRSIEGQTGRDLWVLPLEGRKPWVFLKTNFEENAAYFSPDGRWVTYMSNESGRSEIYVRPFVVPTGQSSTRNATSADAVDHGISGQWQVSTAGGIHPRWRNDGRELYYLGPGGEMMAAPIKVTGTTFEVGAPVKLFETHIYGGGTDNAQGWQYDVTRDGRFLINTVLDAAAAPITILQNWKPPAN